MYDIDTEEDNYENEVCIMDNEKNVNLNYERKTVEFWNSGKKTFIYYCCTESF